MKDTRLLATVFILAAAITAVILFSVVAAARIYDRDYDVRDDVTARSLHQVRVIRLESDTCTDGIASGLGERGFSVTTRPEVADAVLDVNVTPDGRNLDNIPNFGGFGKKATYSATMRGVDGRILFSTAGEKGSLSMANLCGDIGDDIGDRLKDQKTG